MSLFLLTQTLARILQSLIVVAVFLDLDLFPYRAVHSWWILLPVFNVSSPDLCRNQQILYLLWASSLYFCSMRSTAYAVLALLPAHLTACLSASLPSFRFTRCDFGISWCRTGGMTNPVNSHWIVDSGFFDDDGVLLDIRYLLRARRPRFQLIVAWCATILVVCALYVRKGLSTRTHWLVAKFSLGRTIAS